MSETLVWTGENVDEMEAFARRSRFGFVVGSNYYGWRWWHRAVNKVLSVLPWVWTWEWEPPEDPTVLEVYPTRDPADPSPWHWTTVRPGEAIDRHGFVERAS